MGSRANWSVERVLLVLTFTCSVVAFVFSLGFNWAKLTAHETQIQELRQYRDKEAGTIYLPREVYTTDQRHLARAIEELTAAIKELREQRGRPPYNSRQFDREN